jgi:hypothetical protein
VAWFNFGSQDLGVELAELKSGQRRLEALIVALASIEQSVLDQIGSSLQEVADGVQAIIDDPGNDLGPADMTAVTSAVSRLQDLVANPETPVEPTPDAPPADAGQPTE